MSSQAARQGRLGEALHQYREARGWIASEAAQHTAIATMTWRRLESGLTVRHRTYTAIDKLLELAPGAVRHALNAGGPSMAAVLQAAGYDPLPGQEADRELDVIRSIADALDSLPPPARSRVTRYLLDRYGRGPALDADKQGLVEPTPRPVEPTTTEEEA